MPGLDTEGPIPLGPKGDILWFARGRVAVGVPTNVTGGRPEALVRIRERCEQVGGPIALAILVTNDLERPDEETREDIRNKFDEMAPMLACQSVTILGSGFFVSFFMSIVSRTLRFMRARGDSHRIHTDLESTASWMHEQLNDVNTSLEDVLMTLRWAAGETRAPSH